MDIGFPIKKPKDLIKINVSDTGELLWWSYHLGTSPEKILSIVTKIGNSAEEVEKCLKNLKPDQS